MKLTKKILSILIAVTLVVTLLPVTAGSVQGAELKIKNVTGNKRTLYVGSVYQIKTNAKSVTYSSSKKKVATVSSTGLISTKKKGKTTITVKNTDNGKKVKLKLSIKKAKGYKISKKSGTYTGTQKVKIKAKKGYTIYYTTGKKFKASKKIKSKKSKTIKITKDTTLMLYVKKNGSNITVKKMNKTKLKSENCVTYKYTINKASSDASTSVSNSAATTTGTTVTVPQAEYADTSTANTTTWDSSDLTGYDSENKWSELDSVIYVALADEGVTVTDAEGTEVTDSGVSMESGTVYITTPGNYVLSGTLTDGSVQVKSGTGEYILILNGVNISSSNTAALYATKKATKVTVTLAEGSDNYMSGPNEFIFEEGEDEPDAVLYIKKALIINGSGKLTVNAPYGDAIKCKDQMGIAEGDINITAADDGITGKDSFSMCGGTVNVSSGGDGIKTNLQEDVSLGYVDISGGNITINSYGDGIQADTTATFDDASINITTGYSSSNDSFKGIKAGGDITQADSTTTLAGLVYIKGGTFVLNTVEDSIQSKKDMAIEGGNITATSYNDGIQAEYNLTISGDNTVIDVTTKKNSSYSNDSFKGLKAGTSTDDGNVSSEGTLLIKGGIITVDTTGAGTTTSTTKGDDAVHCNNILQIDGGSITVAAGDDAFHSDNQLVINGGTLTATECYEGIESYEIYLEGGTADVVSSDDGINAAGGNDSSGNAGNNTNPWQNYSSDTSSGTLYIDGGTYTINATGDGLDSNGDIYMTGGTVYVYGPTSGDNGIFDYGDNGVFEKSGGLLIGTGTSNMAVYPTCTSGALCTYQVSGSANRTCSLSDGTTTYTFTPPKSYSLVVISTPNMTSGSQYTLTYNGSGSTTATAVTTVSGQSSGSNPGGSMNPGGSSGPGGR